MAWQKSGCNDGEQWVGDAVRTFPDPSSAATISNWPVTGFIRRTEAPPGAAGAFFTGGTLSLGLGLGFDFGASFRISRRSRTSEARDLFPPLMRCFNGLLSCFFAAASSHEPVSIAIILSLHSVYTVHGFQPRGERSSCWKITR